jgi:branched-chain amino acid transport system permease protein
VTELETHVTTQGEAPEVVGIRNQLRARYRALPITQQWALKIAFQLAVSFALWSLSLSLTYTALFLFALTWLGKVPAFPWRLGLQALVVVVFAIFGPRSLAVILVVVFALLWAPREYRGWLLPLAALVTAIMYPFFYTHMFTIPVFGAFPDVATGVYMVVFIMMAVGLNMVVGYAGLLDLGYVAFYATGAYTAGWFASLQFSHRSIHFGAVGLNPPNVVGIHLSVWLILIIAGVFTAFAGVVIGLPTLRLRGDYLAIVTLGFGEIVYIVARNGDNFGGFNLTNGPNGITPIDSPGWGNTLSRWTDGFLPSNYLTCCKAKVLGHQLASADVYFWTALVLLIFTVFCSIRLRDSRLGRAWVAIREDETAAAAMGIPLMRTKTWAYASGAFFGGMAGAYYAAFKANTFPGDFLFQISVFILCMVVLGGMGNVWGVIIGAAFLAYLNIAGLANTGAWINSHIHFIGHLQFPGESQPGLDVPAIASGIYGLIILIVMLFRPEGLLPSRRREAELHRGVHDQPLYDATHTGA